MSDDSTSVALFQRFCQSMRLRATRVAETSILGERRPDFEVVGHDGSSFVAEVKTVRPNDEEESELARRRKGDFVAMGVTPGERLGRFIGKANPQIKALAAGRPGVLVAFNPEADLRRHTSCYSALTAMRGLDTIDVVLPSNPHDAPTFGPIRSGPRKKMTANANTSTSAIVCPLEVDDDEWLVSVFHNRHAARPFPVAALCGENVSHLRMSEDEKQWLAIAPPGS